MTNENKAEHIKIVDSLILTDWSTPTIKGLHKIPMYMPDFIAEAVNVNAALDNIKSELSNIKSPIWVKYRVQEEMSDILYTDEKRLRQVLINLICFMDHMKQNDRKKLSQTISTKDQGKLISHYENQNIDIGDSVVISISKVARSCIDERQLPNLKFDFVNIDLKTKFCPPYHFEENKSDNFSEDNSCQNTMNIRNLLIMWYSKKHKLGFLASKHFLKKLGRGFDSRQKDGIWTLSFKFPIFVENKYVNHHLSTSPAAKKKSKINNTEPLNLSSFVSFGQDLKRPSLTPQLSKINSQTEDLYEVADEGVDTLSIKRKKTEIKEVSHPLLITTTERRDLVHVNSSPLRNENHNYEILSSKIIVLDTVEESVSNTDTL